MTNGGRRDGYIYIEGEIEVVIAELVIAELVIAEFGKKFGKKFGKLQNLEKNMQMVGGNLINYFGLYSALEWYWLFFGEKGGIASLHYPPPFYTL